MPREVTFQAFVYSSTTRPIKEKLEPIWSSEMCFVDHLLNTVALVI